MYVSVWARNARGTAIDETMLAAYVYYKCPIDVDRSREIRVSSCCCRLICNETSFGRSIVAAS